MSFLAKSIATCVNLVLVVVMAILVVFLVLLVSSPDLPKVTLSSLTVTNFSFTGDYISGYLNIELQALNPNSDAHFSYDDLICSVYHDKQRLASTVFTGFVQRESETTPINVTVDLTQGTTAIGIGTDLATSGFAEFDVKLTTIINWQSWLSAYVRISCDDVVVGGLMPETGGHGKMIGPARNCKIS